MFCFIHVDVHNNFQAVISASLTEKSPFVVPIGKRDHADQAKQSLSTGHSDHLTLLKAYLL